MKMYFFIMEYSILDFFFHLRYGWIFSYCYHLQLLYIYLSAGYLSICNNSTELVLKAKVQILRSQGSKLKNMFSRRSWTIIFWDTGHKYKSLASSLFLGGQRSNFKARGIKILKMSNTSLIFIIQCSTQS